MFGVERDKTFRTQIEDGIQLFVTIPNQRITGASFGNVGMRTRHAQRLACSIELGLTAVKNPLVATILTTQTVLTLVKRILTAEVTLKCGVSVLAVIWMNKSIPVINGTTKLIRRKTEH